MVYKAPVLKNIGSFFMKKVCLLLICLVLYGCGGNNMAYPYGLTENEWNSLSIRDQTRLRRDFYFYEKGEKAYVNPRLEVEGKNNQPAFPHMN